MVLIFFFFLTHAEIFNRSKKRGGGKSHCLNIHSFVNVHRENFKLHSPISQSVSPKKTTIKFLIIHFREISFRAQIIQITRKFLSTILGINFSISTKSFTKIAKLKFEPLFFPRVIYLWCKDKAISQKLNRKKKQKIM